MVEKRPIDVMRDSGGSMDIGTPDDISAVKSAVEVDGKLYVVKEKGIYEIKLADQIDPQRTNPLVPNTQQRVLAYGWDNEIVSRTLLTAQELTKQNFFPDRISKPLVTLAFETLKDLLAMHEMRLSLEAAEAKAKAAFVEQPKNPDGSLRMPWIGDVETRCDAFTLKANHVLVSLRAMAKLFYPGEVKSKWIDSLSRMAMSKYGPDHGLTRTMLEVSPFLFVVNCTRNSIEHADPPRAFVKVIDFEFLPDLRIVPPMIEAVHPTSPVRKRPVGAFMLQFIEGLIFAVEHLIAALCHVNVPDFGTLKFGVTEVPHNQRHNPNVRYTFQIVGGMPPLRTENP